MKRKKPEHCKSNLSAALDKTVEAAVALEISEQYLVKELLTRLKKRISGAVVPLNPQPQKMCDPSAGP